MNKKSKSTLTIVLSAMMASATMTSTTPAFAAPNYVEGQMIVRFKNRMTINEARTVLDNRAFQVERVLVPTLNLFLVKTKDGLSTQSAVTTLSQNPQVRYAQPDHFVKRRDTVPNDTDFSKQWNLYSPQTQVDISAVKAWDHGTGGKDKGGQELVIAIVDGGFDMTHPDLRDNLWTNKGEVEGNGKDDDGNGYIDDVHGWNAYNHNGSIPADYHGTHVAGIAGARGNNGAGIAGINWNVKLMPVAAASGTTSVVAEGYGYVIAMKKLWNETHGAKGANIVSTNSSFGVDYANCKSGEFPIWNDLYEAMGQQGILSAAATANLNIDVDVRGDVPTGCSSDYIVSVTNTTSQDTRNSGAAYGLKSVDLGAPGTAIHSTLPNGQAGKLTGTSMATPHIAGAIAFLHSVASPAYYNLYKSNPAQGALLLKTILLQNVDQIPALKGITVSGGRLNLAKAANAIASYGRR